MAGAERKRQRVLPGATGRTSWRRWHLALSGKRRRKRVHLDKGKGWLLLITASACASQPKGQ